MFAELDSNNNIIINQRSIEDSEKNLLIGIVGDWTKPNTIGYTMLNGGLKEFVIYSSIPVYKSGQFTINGTVVQQGTCLVDLLEKYSGQKCREYHVTSSVATIGQTSNKKGSAWVLRDKQSGLPPAPAFMSEPQISK